MTRVDRERPSAAEEIRRHTQDEIANAQAAPGSGRRDISEAIVEDVDAAINDTDTALDRGPRDEPGATTGGR